MSAKMACNEPSHSVLGRFGVSLKARKHRIGAHTSAAGGVDRAAEEAAEIGCNALQVFTRSPRMWRGTAPSRDSIDRLWQLRQDHDLHPLVVHGSYLTNLAAADASVLEKSMRSFRLELDNARAIGADYLIIHPGSARGQFKEQAIDGFAAALAVAQQEFEWGGLRLLLENTAGGGATLGRSFSELADLREAVSARCEAPLGFCIDTAHCFEAGYDVSTEPGLRDTVLEMREFLDLEHVCVLHANDSKTALGSNSDRHASIGEGRIGPDAFARMLRHPQLQTKPFILETPLIDESHRENVRRLWLLASSSGQGGRKAPEDGRTA